MKCTLRRKAALKEFQVNATIGEETKGSKIYLDFLEYVNEHKDEGPTYEGINEEMLFVSKEDAKGKRIVDYLMSAGMLKEEYSWSNRSNILKLTECGNIALIRDELPVPVKKKYSFIFTEDSAFKYEILDYNESKEQQQFGKENKEISPESPSWLTDTKYPVGNGSDSNNEPKIINLPEKENKPLFLYQIDEKGNLKDTNKKITVEVEFYLDEDAKGKYVSGKKDTIFDLREPTWKINDLLEKIESYHSELIGLKASSDSHSYSTSFSSMSETEKRSGKKNIELETVDIHKLGRFDELKITDMTVVVSQINDARLWCFYKLVEMIDTFITRESYAGLVQEAVNWMCDHIEKQSARVDGGMMPDYDAFAKFFTTEKYQIPQEAAEYFNIFQEQLNERPELRWYVLSPYLLTIPEGELI